MWQCRVAAAAPLGPPEGGKFGHGNQLRLVGHVGHGHLLGSLHVGEHAVHAGGADVGAVLGQHAHQRDGVAVVIYHFYLLRLCAHCSHQGDCDHHK